MVQRAHRQRTYGGHPGMYGEGPSEPAVHVAAVFKASGAREGFSVMATDGFPRTGRRTCRRYGAGGDEE
ncbi:hypothetical protein [Streptomyces sp. NPDC058612]|uniref:hypothetical protein n=1 Tax=Streptomyces sp. NPDC058612 TaxID=3346555 RepID=UPI003648DD0B